MLEGREEIQMMCGNVPCCKCPSHTGKDELQAHIRPVRGVPFWLVRIRRRMDTRPKYYMSIVRKEDDELGGEEGKRREVLYINMYDITETKRRSSSSR